MLHVICTRLRPGHLSVCVGDSLRRSEEIVKKNLELRLLTRSLLLLSLLLILCECVHVCFCVHPSVCVSISVWIDVVCMSLCR